MDYSPSDGTWQLGEQASLLSEMRLIQDAVSDL